MYEGQANAICQSIIEENWLEYLKFVKAQADKDWERQQKRMKALEGINDPGVIGLSNLAAQKEAEPGRRYYDLGLNGFWNWYIENKL